MPPEIPDDGKQKSAESLSEQLDVFLKQEESKSENGSPVWRLMERQPGTSNVVQAEIRQALLPLKRDTTKFSDANKKNFLELASKFEKNQELLLNAMKRLTMIRDAGGQSFPEVLKQGALRQLDQCLALKALIGNILPPDGSGTAAPLDGEVNRQRIVAITEKSDKLLTILRLPPHVAKGWKTYLPLLFEVPPSPAQAAQQSSEHQEQIGNAYKRLCLQQQQCLRTFENLLRTLDKDAQDDPATRTAILGDLALLGQLKSQYDLLLNRKADNSGLFIRSASVFFEECAEEGLEELTKIGSSGEWSMSWMKNLDKGAQRALLRSYVQVRHRLLSAGVRNVPTLSRLFNSTGGKVMGDVFGGLRPDSYATVLLFAYYLHQADDKAAASLQFASSLLMSGISNAALGALERYAASRLGVGHIITKIPGHPVIKIAAALILVFAESKLGIVDRSIKRLEAQVEPAAWDRAGVIASTFSGSALFGQMGEIAYQTGLLDVIPGEQQQMEYLSQRILIADYDQGTFWNNLSRDIANWDAMVEQAVERDPNPVRKRLSLLYKIDTGPGGRTGWIQRQAFNFYGQAETLRSIEEELGQKLVTDGILKNPRALGLYDAAISPGAQKGIEGDTGVRTIMQTDLMDAVRKHIDSIRSSNDKDERVLLYDQYTSLACELAKRRCVYEALKVYSSTWTQPRRLRDPGEKKDRMLLPEIVEEGIVAELAFKSERFEQLRRIGNESRSDYGRYLGNLVLVKSEASEKINMLGKVLTLGQVETVESPVPLVYIKAIRNAAEAAAAYLPEAHDVNVLFADLQRYVDTKKKLTYPQGIFLRDQLTDAIRMQAEQTVPYADAPSDIRRIVPFSSNGKVFYAEQVAPPTDAPIIRALVKNAFQRELNGASITLLQAIRPETKSQLVVMTATSIHCAGPDPKFWTVTIRRHHEAHREDVPRPYETFADKGFTETIPFEQWKRAHPHAALGLATEFEGIRQVRTREYQEKRIAIAEAKTRAATGQQFVEIPATDGYECKIGQEIVFMQKSRLLRPRSFNGAQYRPDGSDTAMYTFDLRRPSGVRTISVKDFSFFGTENAAADAQEKTIARRALTTPIEGEDRASLAAVMNLARSNERHKHYFIPVNAQAAFGVKAEYYYETLFEKLLPRYRAAKDKRAFLQKLFDLLESRKEEGITKSVMEDVGSWFEEHAWLFEGDAASPQRQNLLDGENILGVKPDEDGVYVVQADRVDKRAPIYFRFSKKEGWQWTPDSDQSRWFSPDRQAVSWGPNTFTPSPANLQVLQAIAACQSKERSPFSPLPTLSIPRLVHQEFLRSDAHLQDGVAKVLAEYKRLMEVRLPIERARKELQAKGYPEAEKKRLEEDMERYRVTFGKDEEAYRSLHAGLQSEIKDRGDGTMQRLREGLQGDVFGRARYSDAWTNALRKADGAAASEQLPVLVSGDMHEDDERDAKAFNLLLRAGKTSRKLSNAMFFVKSEKPEGTIYISVFVHPKPSSSDYYFLTHSLYWPSGIQEPSVNLPISMVGLDGDGKEYEALKGLLPQRIIDEKARMQNAAGAAEKQAVMQEGDVLKKLQLAANSQSEFIPLFPDKVGRMLHAVHHEGKLLVMRESQTGIDYVLLELGAAGGNGGQGTLQKLQALAQADGQEWVTTGKLKQDVRMAMGNQLWAGELTPEHALLRKVRILPRHGEPPQAAVRRILSEFEFPNMDLVGDGRAMEMQLARLYAQIGQGDPQNAETLRERFLQDMFNETAKALRGQEIDRRTHERLNEQIIENARKGKYGKSLQGLVGPKKSQL